MSTRRLRTLVADPRTWAFALALILLLISIPAYTFIPGWGKPWGLDLKNVYLFHACSGRDDPYLVTGAQCGDPFQRAMPYPPLMYWALVWMRWVSFPAARWIWAAFIVLVLLWAALVWSRPEPGRAGGGRVPAIAFGVLLVSQFPAVFAIERGNNDTFCVLLWTAAIALHLRERRFLAGCAAGLAAAAKLYPGVGCAVLLAGLLGSAIRGRKERDARGRPRWLGEVRFAAGLAAAPALVTLAFREQTRHYVEQVLPAFAAHLPGPSLHSHSVPGTVGPGAGAVSAVIVAAWCVAALLRMDRAPLEIFAGALAVSTYVARTSFDYNLVTVYPLLIVLCARVVEPSPPAEAPGSRWGETPHSPRLGRSRVQAMAGQWRVIATFLVLTLGLIAVTGHRGWFGPQAVLHTVLQIAWLGAAAILAAARRPPAEGALQPEPEAR